MQINSWNYRGLGNPLKYEAVKDLLKIAPVDILLLQKTKIDEEALLHISKNKWKLNSGKAISAGGYYGVLETLWHEEKFYLINWYSTQHWVYTELSHLSSKSTLALFNFYVHVNYLEKKECWLSISNFLESNSPSNIILADDLNITLAPNEKKGGMCGRGHL